MGRTRQTYRGPSRKVVIKSNKPSKKVVIRTPRNVRIKKS